MTSLWEKWITKLNLSFFTDPPIVKLNLGHTFDPSKIKTGDDVYFECKVLDGGGGKRKQQNRIEWYHNVSISWSQKWIYIAYRIERLITIFENCRNWHFFTIIIIVLF